jgi:hypothetical protein
MCKNHRKRTEVIEARRNYRSTEKQQAIHGLLWTPLPDLHKGTLCGDFAKSLHSVGLSYTTFAGEFGVGSEGVAAVGEWVGMLVGWVREVVEGERAHMGVVISVGEGWEQAVVRGGGSRWWSEVVMVS